MHQNFIADYLTFNSGNEAHQHWHLWCGLSVLASCVSRKVWINMGYFRYYPQLYIVLLGPPGDKKSTAMNIAKRLVREVGDIPFSGQCQSKENLVKELSENERQFVYDPAKPPYLYTPINCFVTELSQFIGIDPVKMMDFLVAVWGEDVYDMKTQKHGVQLITGPFVNLLACTTPSWVTNYLKTDIITGGFSRRCLFVLEYEETKRIAIPVVTDEMRAAWNRCVVRGQQLRNIYGEFTWTPDAKSYFTHWYETRTIAKDPNIEYFDKTKFEQALKVGMLLSLAQSDDRILTLDHFQLALAMVDKVLVKLPQVFAGVGRNELAAISVKMEGMIRKEGGLVLEKEVVDRLWADAHGAEIYQIIAHMESVGRVKRLQQSTKEGVIRQWLATPEKAAEIASKASAPVPPTSRPPSVGPVAGPTPDSTP